MLGRACELTELRARRCDLNLQIQKDSRSARRSRTLHQRAFRRHKFITRALPPLAGLGLSPVALYVLASQIGATSSVASTQDMTLAIFLGGLTYVGVVSSMGFIALSTANDQMQRVTWQTGTPLRERWMREEERAALDKIACAWGFQEKWRQGEEEGADWDALREYIGQKGMVLDRTELMEGMDY